MQEDYPPGSGGGGFLPFSEENIHELQQSIAQGVNERGVKPAVSPSGPGAEFGGMLRMALHNSSIVAALHRSDSFSSSVCRRFWQSSFTWLSAGPSPHGSLSWKVLAELLHMAERGSISARVALLEEA
ncbi:hypothetical protein MTO96_034299 [Rhipicephalus appendiculatus]